MRIMHLSLFRIFGLRIRIRILWIRIDSMEFAFKIGIEAPVVESICVKGASFAAEKSYYKAFVLDSSLSPASGIVGDVP